LTLAEFEPARYDDSKLRAFAQRIEVRADPALSGVQAVVDIETTDGNTFSERCEHPRGSPENRLSRAQIERKFRTYANGRLSDARIEEVIGAILRLEHLGSVRTLMDALRQSSHPIADEHAPRALARA
jgi:2-methylcitrate dehydratase